MAGLVGYASSDEGSDDPGAMAAESENAIGPAGGAVETAQAEAAAAAAAAQPRAEQPPAERPRIEGPQLEEAAAAAAAAAETTAATTASEPVPAPAGDAPRPDVIIGPRRPAAAATTDEDDAPGLPPLEAEDGGVRDGGEEEEEDQEPPLSPYTAERTAVRQLTLPRVPDFDIPGSPAGGGATPSAALRALNKKCATFLDLKKKGTHFNTRLAESDAMKNPGLMDKLMAFVGMGPPGGGGGGADGGSGYGDEGSGGSSSHRGRRHADRPPVDTGLAARQYATTLPTELWDPAAFPAAAYRRSLRRLQEEAAKQRARAPGERVDFVPATTTTTTTTAAASAGKRRTRFD